MTNNYKYRGKRIDGAKNWAYGSLIEGKRCFIIRPENLKIGENGTISNTSVQEVDPKTVGQWSGETDMDKKEIYKDDELQRFKTSGKPYMNTKIVGWERGAFTNIEHAKESKVISNIHDNEQ